MGTAGVENMLDLSTGHMPATSPAWGGLRVVEHAYGWIVFVLDDLSAQEAEAVAPEWIRPVMAYAREHTCILINFDRDAEHVDGLPTWEW